MFLVEGAPYEINVEGSTREDVINGVNSFGATGRCSQDVFNASQREVTLLMGRDIWLRFRDAPAVRVLQTWNFVLNDSFLFSSMHGFCCDVVKFSICVPPVVRTEFDEGF